jgi:hypothetical protein
VVSLLAVALSLAMVTVIATALQAYEQNLGFVAQGAQRLATNLAAQNDVRNLVAASMGWEVASNETISKYRSQILANASIYQVNCGAAVLCFKLQWKQSIASNCLHASSRVRAAHPSGAVLDHILRCCQ